MCCYCCTCSEFCHILLTICLCWWSFADFKEVVVKTASPNGESSSLVVEQSRTPTPTSSTPPRTNNFIEIQIAATAAATVAEQQQSQHLAPLQNSNLSSKNVSQVVQKGEYLVWYLFKLVCKCCTYKCKFSAKLTLFLVLCEVLRWRLKRKYRFVLRSVWSKFNYFSSKLL